MTTEVSDVDATEDGDRRMPDRRAGLRRLSDRTEAFRPVDPVVRTYLERAPFAFAATMGDDHLVGYANGTFQRTLRVSGVSVIGRPLAELPFALDRATLIDLVDSVYRGVELENPPVIEQHEEARGMISWRPAIWPISAASGFAGVIVTLHDVSRDLEELRLRDEMDTRLREINERLLLSALRERELSRRAEAASEAKSVFLASMSHELRTPLSAIIGYEELLANGITGPLSDPQRVQLGRIKLSALHLLTLIDEILGLVRLDAGQEPVANQIVDVGAILDEARLLVAPLAAERGVPVRFHKPTTIVPIRTDPVKLRQILLNLLTNAIRFTDAGEVQLRVGAEGDSLLFEVADTGIGIPAESAERIFEPFYQVNQRPSRKVGGTGLGLSITRRLAQLLGGAISVQSAVGVGSTFTLRLPADLPAPGGVAP
jgi:signal transduction histidine kinase